MTREQAKQKLVALGIAEPTEEQVTDFLNTIGTETKKEKDRADGLKAKADKADELQTQLDDLNSQNLSDIEKAQAIAERRNIVSEKFKVTSEQAKQIVKDDGNFDYDVLGQIISDKEQAAATAKEQEIASNATNPGGGSAGGTDEKSTAEKIAEKMFGGQKQENNIISHYVGGN